MYSTIKCVNLKKLIKTIMTRKMISFSIFVAIMLVSMLLSSNLFATTYHSTDGQQWTDFTLSSGDIVYVDAGESVYVTGTVDQSSLNITIYVNGTLVMGNPGFLKLGGLSMVYMNNLIQVDNTNNNDKISIGAITYNENDLFSLKKGDILTEGGPVPVTLYKFNCQRVNETIKFSWITASEQFNDYFLIEFSSDANDWSNVATINGHGSTNSFQSYAFSYVSTNAGYYRLSQVDFDGKLSILKIINVPSFAVNDVRYFDMQGRESNGDNGLLIQVTHTNLGHVTQKIYKP